MNLRALVSVTGKPGLFRLIGQNKGGFILETLDNAKIKSVVNLNNTKMATLEDITIYGEEEEIRLIDILEKIKSENITVPTQKDSAEVLRDFFRIAAPGHDESKVYTSDIKKIVSWYSIIKEFPLFDEEAPAPLAQ